MNIHPDFIDSKSVRSSIGEASNSPDSGISDKFIVSNELFVENRKNFVLKIKSAKPNSIVFLQGQRNRFWYNTGMKWSFQQDSFFLWLFGVKESGFYGAIDTKTEKSYLFFPPAETVCAICNEQLSAECVKKKYAVDFALSIKDMEVTLSLLNRSDLVILQDEEQVQILKPNIPTLDCFSLDLVTLWPVLVSCRMLKSPFELELLRYICALTNEGLRYLMLNANPGVYAFQAEALFMFYVEYVASCKQEGAFSIITTVKNLIRSNLASKAGRHDEVIEDGEMVYIEGGASYHGYRVSVRTTFPINRNFSAVQRDLQNVVGKMRLEVHRSIKPGVDLEELYSVACNSLIKELIKLDLLRGLYEEIIAEGIADSFQLKPFFGMVGIDGDDVGKHLLVPQRTGSESHREHRMLEPRMIISLHYSCYFFPEKLKEEKILKYLSSEINTYKYQGASIQDIVLINSVGFEVLCNHPKSSQEIKSLSSDIDFRGRKGKDVDIIEGRKLFPKASDVIEMELNKYRKKYKELNSD